MQRWTAVSAIWRSHSHFGIGPWYGIPCSATHNHAHQQQRHDSNLLHPIRNRSVPTGSFQRVRRKLGKHYPRCGGHLVGYFLPYEGTNNVGWGLIAFDSLASYEAYRKKLKADPEARRNFETAVAKRVILREERTFVEVVDGTFNVSAAPGEAK